MLDGGGFEEEMNLKADSSTVLCSYAAFTLNPFFHYNLHLVYVQDMALGPTVVLHIVTIPTFWHFFFGLHF